jgi:hypothetical protein
MTAPTFGGLSARLVAIPIVMVAPASAAHIHRLLNHSAMTCLRRGYPSRRPWRSRASVRTQNIDPAGFAGSPAFAEGDETSQ